MKELDAVERELRENQDISASLAERRKVLLAKASQLKNTIAQLTPVKFTVSDHALVRYLERAKGVNLEQYRLEIASAVREFAEVGGGDGEINGFRIRDNTVVTYIGKDT